MAIQVVSVEMKSTDRIEVLLEAEHQHELVGAGDPAATAEAIKAASARAHRPGLNSAGPAFPIDANGNYSEALAMGAGGAVVAYRRLFQLRAA